MEDKTKTEVIRMRIDTGTKERFYSICEKKAINPSALLRQLVQQWLNEQVEDRHTTCTGTQTQTEHRHSKC